MVIVQVEEIVQYQYLVIVLWVSIDIDGWYIYCSGYFGGDGGWYVFEYYDVGVCGGYGFGIFYQLVCSIVVVLDFEVVQVQY